MKVRVDAEKCQGHQMCAIAAPDLFESDDLGYAHEIGDGTARRAWRTVPGGPQPTVPSGRSSSRSSAHGTVFVCALLIGSWRGGRWPVGFDLSNSPVGASIADLDGRTIVQRTSAGTQGLVAARSATRMWTASLVCASATAAAVNTSGLGAPTYVITGRFPDRPDDSGEEDVLAASFIEGVRRGEPVDPVATADAVPDTDDARHTLLLGPEHVHPDDIDYCVRVDHFDFAMEVERTARGLRLVRRDP